tara:strand:+ start:698 stop:901 length:204 start_codon:yes stop_codon:yes gene_type:complete
MPKWIIYAVVSGSKFLGEVEAATKEEAIQKAWGLDSCYASVCHQCSRQIEDAEVTDIHAEPLEESDA